MVGSLWGSRRDLDQLGYELHPTEVLDARADVADHCSVSEFGALPELLELQVKVRTVLRRHEWHATRRCVLGGWIALHVRISYQVFRFGAFANAGLAEVDLQTDAAEFVLQVKLKAPKPLVATAKDPNVVHPSHRV